MHQVLPKAVGVLFNEKKHSGPTDHNRHVREQN